MTSTVESGHARLLFNFRRLGQSVMKIPEFKPSNPNLLPEALQLAADKSQSAMNETANAALAYRAAVKAREKAFEPLGSFSTRVCNTLKVSDKEGKSYEISRTYLRKIHGTRVKGKRTEEEQKADAEAGIVYKEVSSSQMSYDSLVDNFGMLVRLAVTNPAYKPNEKDLQNESLLVKHEDLKNKNAAVVSAASDLFKARAKRNDLLYKEMTGLVDLALDTKTYLKGAFGTKSSYYLEVAGLTFKRLRK